MIKAAERKQGGFLMPRTRMAVKAAEIADGHKTDIIADGH